MTEHADQPSPPRRKWKRVLAAVVACVALTLGLVVLVVYLRFANPDYVRAMAREYMQQFTNGRVEVGSAEFSWLEGVQLFDVVVYDSGSKTSPPSDGAMDANGEVVFSCKRLRLDANLLAGIFGRLHIKSVVAIEPRCLVVRDGADGRTNLAKLINPEAFVGSEDADDSPPVPVPAIELRDAHVRVVYRQDGHDRVMDEQTLTIRARPLHRDSRYYDIVWRGGGERIAHGRSQVDMHTGRLRNVQGGLPWMSLEAVMSVVNAQNPEAGAWSDLLGLEGAVRATDYDFGGSAAGGGSRSATVQLAHATLSIPINNEEAGLGPDERYLHFDDVLGTITLTAEGIDANFEGVFHGSPCDVQFHMTGAVDQITTLDDVDFTARAVVRDLVLPRDDPQSHPSHHRFIARWAPIRRFYREFKPHGAVDLEIDVEKRAGADKPIETRRVRLVAKGAGATYCKFPYTVEQLHGVVEFTPEGVFLKALGGVHDAGRIVTEGWLSAPRRHAAADLTFTGRNMPLEAELIAALPEGFRRIQDRFDPQGQIDATVHLRRDGGEGGVSAPWHTTTDVAFEGLSATYDGFPLPTTALAGSLHFDGKTVEVRDVTGTVAGGSVTLAGHGEFDHGEVEAITVSLKGDDFVFSDGLLAALPEGVRSWVRRFQPSGRFGIDLQLAQENGRWSHDADVTLHDATLVPEEFAVPVVNVTGHLRLRNRRIEIDGFKGSYGEAQLVAGALIDRDGNPADDFIRIESKGLVVDDALQRVLPENVQTLLATWRVEGPIDVDVEMRKGSKPEDPWSDVRVLARLKNAVVRHDRFPLPFEHVAAEVAVDGQGVRGTGIRARYGDSDVSVAFVASKYDGMEEGNIEIDASALVLDKSLKDVFPESVRQVWDRVGISGQADVHLHPLAYRRADANAPTVWSVEGALDLSDVSLTKVASIEDLQGKVTLSGTLMDRLGGTVLKGKLEDASLRLFGRDITDVSTPWSHVQTADGQGRFSLDDVHGILYEGILTNRTEIHFDAQDTRYDVSGAVHGMDIKRFLAADRQSAPETARQKEVSGRADASLTLVGVVGTPASRKGTGRIEVREGELFHMPLMTAVLNVINLSLPSGPSTDQAEANFYVLGSRLKLDDIYFEGRGLAFVGSGVFSIPDKGLDLNLVQMNPHKNMRVPGLTDAVETAMGQLVELHVTGPLHQPRVLPRALPGLSDELKRLFKKKEAKKMQATSR